MTVLLNGYDKFPQHFRALAPEDKRSVGAFLEQLQKTGPYAPNIQKACALQADGSFAFEYAPNRTIFWRVAEYDQKGMIIPTDQDTIYVDILALGNVKVPHA